MARMTRFKERIQTLRDSNRPNDDVLEEFENIIDIHNVEGMQLEEYENMTDQIAHIKATRERQIAYSAFQKQLEEQFRQQAVRMRLLYGENYQEFVRESSESESDESVDYADHIPKPKLLDSSKKHEQIKNL